MQSSWSLQDINQKSVTKGVLETIYEVESIASSSDPPMEEWSSLLIPVYEENKKYALYKEGLYSPGSGEVCAKYIALSDSDVLNHPYYKYPAVVDPGIVTALCDPSPEKKYDEVGQRLYLELCDETGMAPVKLFYKGLFKNVINLKYYCVNPWGVRNMCLALAENNIVQRLDLTSCFLNNDACFHLGELMATTSTLTELILAQCRIGYYGLLRMIKSLDKIDLKMLDLCKNRLGDESIPLIAEKIIRGAKMKRLNLGFNNISMPGILELANSLTFNRFCFTHLNLSGNLLSSPKALQSLIRSLYDYPKLIELNISRCGIPGGRYLADILMAKSLQRLDLSHNCLSMIAVEALRSKLRTSKSLRYLNLSGNPLQPKEAYALLQELRYPQVKLLRLVMDGIDVTKEFPVAMQSILSLKHREKTQVSYGRIMNNYTLKDADFREIMMRRLNILGRKTSKRNITIDIPGYILEKRKETPILLPKRMMMDLKQLGSKITLSFIERLPIAFPGPRIDKKTRAIDLESMADYTARMWPDAKPIPMGGPMAEALQPQSQGRTPGSSGKTAGVPGMKEKKSAPNKKMSKRSYW